MMSKTYRENLIETVHHLYDMAMELELDIINLAMSGEFAEVDDQFEVGDTLRLTTLDFEGVNDQNVQRLVQVFHLIREVHNSLVNINHLSNKNTEVDDSDLPF